MISEGVDISREVGEAGVGLVTRLDPAELASAIDTLLSNEGSQGKNGCGWRRVRA